MAKIEIELNNGYLELEKDIGFGLQYSVAEVKDATKRKSSYSKTITLPGTKNNNFQLGNLFDINEDFTYFNPNIKTPAKIIVDSTTVMKGFLQLRNINKLNNTDLQSNQVQYEVVVFDDATDFFGVIGDSELRELDFSEFDHIYAYSSITATWNTSRTADDGYAYPLMYKNSDTYETKDFKPSIYHKAYLEKIATAAGFSLGGTFMDNTRYEKEIIPFNGDIPVITSAEYTRRLWKAGMSLSAGTMYEHNVFGGVKTQLFPRQQFVATWSSAATQTTLFDNDTTNGNFDPNNHYSTVLNKWTVDRNGNYNIRGGQVVELELTTLQTVTGVTSDGGKVSFRCSKPHNLSNNQEIELIGFSAYSGTWAISNAHNDPYTFRIFGLPFTVDDNGQFGVEAWGCTYSINNPSNPYATNLSFSNSGFGHEIRDSFTIYKNNSLYASYTLSSLLPAASEFGAANFNSANNYTITTKHYLAGDRYNAALLAGDEITWKFSSVKAGGQFGTYYQLLGSFGSSGPRYGYPVPFDIKHKLLSADTVGGIYRVSEFYNEANTTSITDGDTIYMNDYIPDKVKQKDLIIDLIKRYNVYISIDPDNDKKLILDSRDDYYAKGETLDWTDKKDYSNQDKIELLSDLQKKELHLTYKKGGDDWNKNYSLAVGDDIYGMQKVEFDNEFVKGIEKVESPFEPTPLIYNSINRVAIVPAINAADPKNNMRVLYFAGLTNTINNANLTFKWIDGNNVTYTTFNQYPFAGHYDNPYDPTIDTNFGVSPYEWYNELNSTTNNTQYSLYWRNYIRQISEGRMVTSKFYLTEVDIAFIKNNLNAKIFVKDSYYYIDKIQDYDPTKNGLTTVKLIKIIEGVPFVPESKSTTVGPIRDDGGTGISTGFVGAFKSRNTIRGGGVGSGSGTGIQPGNDTSGNDAQTANVIIQGNESSIGTDSYNTMIIGDNNVINNNTTESGIVGGSGNTINSEVTGSWIIGSNNKTITQDNEIWIGGIRVLDGVVKIPYNLIDGGEDINQALFPKYIINYIDGGEDVLRGYNSTNTENYIDGDI